MTDPISVAVEIHEYRDLRHDAECWRLLSSSPHCEDLLAEFAEWMDRRDLSEATAAMAQAVNWRAVASASTYAELERRRSTYSTAPLTPEQIRTQAAASWASVDRNAA